MKKVKRFGVSLEDDLLRDLDKLVEQHKFPNRSQAIRFLIRSHKVGAEWKKNEIVAGALVLVYDHHKRDLVINSMHIQHDYAECILSSQHVHLDHNNCFEIIALKGKASKLKELTDRLIALKGIKHGKLVMSVVK